MKPIICVSETIIRDKNNVRLIYDPQFCVWSVYNSDLQVYFSEDGIEALAYYQYEVQQTVREQ